MVDTLPLVAVVDDEDAIRKALKRLLRSAGMGVETYASGSEFLASLASHKPSCVVLDIRMPGMTGFDVQSRKFPRWPRNTTAFSKGARSRRARH